MASNSSHNLPFGSVRLAPSSYDQRGQDFSASRDSVAAAPRKMSSDQRRHWRRGSSIRSKSQPSLPDSKVKLRGDGGDGFVPYRPPYVSPSIISLSAPVQPSGAQGIGLAPAPAAHPERPQKKTIFGWFGRRKTKQKLASVSTPALLEQPSIAHGNSIPLGYGYPRYGHRPHGAQSADLLSPSTAVAGSSSGVKESPSVLTGLVAPKMLFSPLSRSMRTDDLAGDYPYGHKIESTPHIEHYPLPPVQQTPQRPYPRVGDNMLLANFHGQRSGTPKWPDESTVTLHSEGSRSRLAVNTVCDALTFPRPRMHAHEVTPPDTPEFDMTVTGGNDDGTSAFDRVYAAGEVRVAEREEWADITRKTRSASLKSNRSQLSTRRSDEWSIRENQPGTPVHNSWSRQTLPSGQTSQHKRSKSTASSIRTLFRSGTQRLGRFTRSYDNLPQQAMDDRTQSLTKPHSSRPSTAPTQQTSWSRPGTAPSHPPPAFGTRGLSAAPTQHPPSSSRPETAPSQQPPAFGSSRPSKGGRPSHSSSRPNTAPTQSFSSRPNTGRADAPSIATSVTATPKSSITRPHPPRSLSLKQRLPKSTSTPSLAAFDDDRRISCAPHRSRSTRSHTLHTRSDPDLLNHQSYSAPHSTTGHSDHGGDRLGRAVARANSAREGERGRHGSPPPKLRRRQTGPPRTFQFRLQPPTHRHAPSGSNLVMVGGAGAPDNSRLDSSRLHIKQHPRIVDFADSYTPTATPHLPTPERSSPFNYAFPDSEIGLAITTDVSVAPVQHRLPMDTPPSARPQTTEDPSSAHARYVLARQHRRQQTMRAFQSTPTTPSGGDRKSPDIYPQAPFLLPLTADQAQRFSQVSIYSQNTTQSSAHSGGMTAPMSPTRFSRTGYPSPHRQAAVADQVPIPPVPQSPKSPKTAFFGRPRDDAPRGHSPPPSPSSSTRSVLYPRTKPAPPVRPRTPPSSWHRRRASSLDHAPAVPPLPPMATPPKQHTPLLLNKSLPAEPPNIPPLPLITASAAVPARPSSMTKIPPQRRPPSRPPPPTPTPPVGSRTNSTDEQHSTVPSRSQSLRSLRSMNDLASMTTAPIALRAATPPNNDTYADESTPRSSMVPSASFLASKGHVATPPPATALPTIMDDSPTPIRQTRVSVLAGMPSPSTPIAASLGALEGRRSLAASTSSDHSASLGRSRNQPGPPLSAGVVSTTPTRSPPAAPLFAARTPASPITLSTNTDATFPQQMSCWPGTAASVPDVSSVGYVSNNRSAPTNSSAGYSSINKSVTDGQSSTSAHTLMTTPSTSTLGGDCNNRELQLERATIASATSSVSLAYTETEDSWATAAGGSREGTSNEADSDSDSEGGLSEATLPELFPSSSSALSQYEDAREGSTDWVVHEEDEGEVEDIPTTATPPRQPHETEDNIKSAVTPPVVSAPFSPLSPVSEPTTPPRQVRILLEDDDNRRTIMPDSDDGMESLMITPRPRGSSRSPRTPGTNNTEPFEFDRERRSPSGSVSSGSEGSVRNSMDENFRGLFFRTPQITSPTTRRPVTAPSTAPSMINPPTRSDSRPGTAPQGVVPPFGQKNPPTTIDEEAIPIVAGEDLIAIAPIPMPPLPAEEQDPFAHDPFAHQPRAVAPVHERRQPRPLSSIHDRDRHVPHGGHFGRAAHRGGLGPPIGLEIASPYRDANAAKRALSLDTRDDNNQPIPFPPQYEQQSSSAPSNNAPPSPSPAVAQAHGLGVVMTPLNDTDPSSLPGWDNSSRIGSSTPPLTALPRDDSWISASYRQAAAKESRSATPGHVREQLKTRVTYDSPSLSPTTFGVASSTFGVTPIVPYQQQNLIHQQVEQQTQRARLPKGSISSTSSFNIVTPHNDVVDRFPSPPRSRPRTG